MYRSDAFQNRKHSRVLATDQTPAKYLANMMNYGNQSYAHWYGYTGPGYGPFNWPRPCTFNMNYWSMPVYVVRSITQPQNVDTVSFSSITFNNGSIKDFCQNVPFPKASLCPRIPANPPVNYGDGWLWAPGTPGTSSADGNMAVWDLDTDRMWEFWTPQPVNWSVSHTNWQAGAASYISSVARFDGRNWDNVNWGTRGSKVGLMGGVLTQQDIRDVFHGGAINHALVFAVPNNGLLGGSPVLPAIHADGNQKNSTATIPSGFPGAGGANPAYGIDAIQEAQAFTFPDDVDLSGCTYPMARAVATAIRDYGMYDVDTSGTISIYCEPPMTLGSPYHLQGASAIDPMTLSWPEGDPFAPSGLSGGSVLNQLPWDKLQVLAPVAR